MKIWQALLTITTLILLACVEAQPSRLLASSHTFEQFWHQWLGKYVVTKCTASPNTFLRLGYILTARFCVLCTDCWCSLVLHFQCQLQRQLRSLQLLCRHHYMHRYIFPACFTCFHKFLLTVNRILTSSTYLKKSAWIKVLFHRYIKIVTERYRVLFYLENTICYFLSVCSSQRIWLIQRSA